MQLDHEASDRFWSGDFRGALEKYETIFDGLASPSRGIPVERSRQLAETELRRAATLRRCGSLLAAKAAAERAVTRAEGFRDIQALSLTLLGAIDHSLGLAPLGALAMDRALELAKKCNEKVQAHAWSLRGRVLVEGGHVEQGRRAYLKARELFKRQGDANQTTAEGNIGECLRLLGRFEASRVWFSRALELARRTNLPYSEVTALLGSGQLALDEGRLDEAERCSTAALSIAKPREHWLHVFKAERINLLVARKRQPGASNRNRMALLKKLLVRLGDFTHEPEVKEFMLELEAAARKPRKASR